MRVITNKKEMTDWSLDCLKQGKEIGFVPTMGALHEGHLSLIRKSAEENNMTVVSIFVNPVQFLPGEDFDKYPRTFEADKKLAAEAGADILFYPDINEMYPENFETVVRLTRLPHYLCGLSRPGHFDGVAVVVAKLFHLVMPQRAYFGQKDYQQTLVIRKMVRDLDFNIEIRVLPIVREEDGLAMSSRNRYLSEEDRQTALILNRALQFGKKMIAENTVLKRAEAERKIREMIEDFSGKISLDYVSVTDADDLSEPENIPKRYLIALAVYIGDVRLIDNTLGHR